jgi:hypothetical protein
MFSSGPDLTNLETGIFFFTRPNMKSAQIMSFWIFFVFVAGVSAQDAGVSEGFAVPPGGINSQVMGSLTDGYEVLPPPEKALLEGRWSAKTARGVHGVSMAGLASSLAFSAAGIGILFSGAGDSLDAGSIHTGILMAVSGSLSSALFSILFDATRATSKE